MMRLQEKGIRFYLDDFGTGYSNLSSMFSLPFEVIKFDQSLVRMIDVSRNGRRTISLLAQLMHENDYRIVAEDRTAGTDGTGDRRGPHSGLLLCEAASGRGTAAAAVTPNASV